MGKGTWPNAWASGLASSRPDADAVGNGAYYLATDTLVLSQSDGASSWTDIATFTDGTAVSAFIETLLDDADAAAAQATLGLVPGTDIQELISDIVDLPTAETDTSLVLAPDGAGGVEFRAETGSGGGPVTPNDLGSLGSTETVDLGNGAMQRGTLDDDVTITVTGFTVDEQAELLLKLTQDGTGGWGITWDADVEFIGDDQPGQSPGDVTFYLLWSDEGDTTIYAAKVGGSDASVHVADTTDAHDASAISFDATGLTNTSATDVQEALEDLDAAIASSGSVPVPWSISPEGGAWTANNRSVGTSNRAIYVPCVIPVACTITGIRVNVTNQSGNICVGLYDDSGNRVATSGSVACPATGNSNVNFTSSYAAAPGRYYMALQADNTTATFAWGESAGGVASAATSRFQNVGSMPLPSTATMSQPISTPAILGVISGGHP